MQVRLLAAAGIFLAVPGWALLRLLLGAGGDRSLRLPATGTLSLAVLAPFLIFWPGSLRAAGAVAVLAAGVVLLASLLRPARPAPPGQPLGLLILPVVAAAAAALWLGAAQEGDSYLHLAITQQALRAGSITHSDAFYAASGTDARYGYTLWHPLLAVLSQAASTSPRHIWVLLPALIAPLYVLSVASLTTAVTGSRAAGLCGAVLVILYHLGPQGGQLLTLAANPSHVACLLLVPTALAFTVLHVRRGGAFVMGVAAATLAVVCVHPFHSLLELLALGGVALPYLLRGDAGERRRAAACLLVALVVTAPFAVLRTSFHLENPFWHERGAHWEIAPGLWAPSPALFFPRRPGYLWVVYGLSLAYLVHPRSGRALRGVAVATVLPLVVALNPLIAPWLGGRVSPQMLPRFDHLSFYVFGFVLAGAALGHLWRSSGGCWGGVVRAGVVVVMAVAGWQCWPGLQHAHAVKQKREAARGFAVLWHELEPIGPHLTPEEVVLSNQATGFLLPSFLPARVVAVPRGSASPAEPYQDQRERDVSAFLDPTSGPRERIAILQRYGSRAALVDTTRNPRVARLLAEAGSGMLPVASSGRFILFRPAQPIGRAWADPGDRMPAESGGDVPSSSRRLP
jgi:hypothetical protein